MGSAALVSSGRARSFAASGPGSWAGSTGSIVVLLPGAFAGRRSEPVRYDGPYRGTWFRGAGRERPRSRTGAHTPAMIERADATPEIRLTDLSKHFRDVRAVDRVSL